ncbi:MAG: 30S ribosomal protein S15 [Candidatus Pelagibacter sp. TMED64]|nr:30S ribosomal protein S15 [Candidatus Pelagibacter sp.]OUU65050.1 MAG: 30S ribosomal protein S15 [Candidatus Pelagibacter sp. TMED64]
MTKKNEIIKSLSLHDSDTGSSQVQIGLLSEKIKKISKHFETNKKDKHSSRGLLKAVNQRKQLLKYLKKKDEESYNKVISKLKLRK